MRLEIRSIGIDAGQVAECPFHDGAKRLVAETVHRCVVIAHSSVEADGFVQPLNF